MLMTKLRNAVLGFALGVCTFPLAIIVWPGFLAWYLWNETDE